MKRVLVLLVTLFTASCATAPVASLHSPQPFSDWSAVDAALGRSPLQPPSGTAPALGLPAAEMDRNLGFTGKPNGGVLQYSVPRAERIVEHGMEIPPAAGMATALNFQPTGNGRAAIGGDFVMLASEVNPVIRELRNGIAVTALHSHMLEEEPRLFFALLGERRHGKARHGVARGDRSNKHQTVAVSRCGRSR